MCVSAKPQSAVLVSKELQGTGRSALKTQGPILCPGPGWKNVALRDLGGGWGLLVISIMQFNQKNSYARQERMSPRSPFRQPFPLTVSADVAGLINLPLSPPPKPLPQFSLAPLITLTSDFEIVETAALKAGLGRAACDLNLLFISQRAGSVNRTRNITAPAVILCHRDQKASRPSRITFLLWAPKHLLIQAL